LLHDIVVDECFVYFAIDGAQRGLNVETAESLATITQVDRFAGAG
jgi:hypothetical protein